MLFLISHIPFEGFQNLLDSTQSLLPPLLPRGLIDQTCFSHNFYPQNSASQLLSAALSPAQPPHWTALLDRKVGVPGPATIFKAKEACFSICQKRRKTNWASIALREVHCVWGLFFGVVSAYFVVYLICFTAICIDYFGSVPTLEYR